jgi:hypothetical protein
MFSGMMLLVSACILSVAAAQQQPQPAKARRGGLDGLSLPSTTARAASASNGANPWQTFAPQGADFSVSLPGQPEEVTLVGREGGQPGRNYRLTAGGLEYDLGHMGKLPEQLFAQPGFTDKFFAHSAQSIAAALARKYQQIKYKLVSEQPVSYDGYEGREYEFAAAGQRVVARLFLVEGSLFALSVLGAESEMTPENVNRFLDSFALTQ